MPDKYLWNEICGCLLLQRKWQLRTFVMQRDIWGRNVQSVWNWEGISEQNLPQNQTHQVRIKVSYQWSWWARYNTSNIPISVLGDSPDAQTVLRNTCVIGANYQTSIWVRVHEATGHIISRHWKSNFLWTQVLNMQPNHVQVYQYCGMLFSLKYNWALEFIFTTITPLIKSCNLHRWVM